MNPTLKVGLGLPHFALEFTLILDVLAFLPADKDLKGFELPTKTLNFVSLGPEDGLFLSLPHISFTFEFLNTLLMH